MVVVIYWHRQLSLACHRIDNARVIDSIQESCGLVEDDGGVFVTDGSSKFVSRVYIAKRRHYDITVESLNFQHEPAGGIINGPVGIGEQALADTEGLSGQKGVGWMIEALPYGIRGGIQ